MIHREKSVSVLCSAYNAERSLANAIESIQAQSMRDWELVLVDDGSTDHTHEIAQAFAQKDERIRIIRNEKNIGLTASLNVGIRSCRGRYIARQDADDASLPDRLQRQLDFATENSCDFLASRCFTRGHTNPRYLWNAVSVLNLRYGNFLCHGTFFFSRKKIIEIGGYDESYRYAQDCELVLRYLCTTKKPIILMRRVLYQFNTSDESISSTKRISQEMFASRAFEAHGIASYQPRCGRLKALLLRNLPVHFC
ncbi:MAG: glycosyltransferase family 2 protein [Aureliella sp.]